MTMKCFFLALCLGFVQYLDLCTCQLVIQSSCYSSGNTLVQRNKATFQYSPRYPRPYQGSTSCTWTYRTVETNYLDIVCNISIACTDSLMISRTGDTAFKNQTIRLCGSGQQSMRASVNKLALSFRSARQTTGGTFVCKITATPKYVLPVTRAATTLTPSNQSGTCSCGGRQSQRIVGGSSATRYEFPWIALLLRNGKGPYCGATIISAKWVVTAAHCTYGLEPQNLTVLCGRYNYSEPQTTEQLLQVVEILSAAFNFSTFFEDIALLQLEKKLTFSITVQPACLPFTFKTRDFTGEPVTVAGWGLTAEDAENPTSSLLKATLKVIPFANCSKALQKMDSIITPEQICAFQLGRDACQGDSGGPMFWTDPAAQKVYVIGIVSYGIGCARPGYPGVYTRVTSYLDWIVSQTGEAFCTA